MCSTIELATAKFSEVDSHMEEGQMTPLERNRATLRDGIRTI